VPEHKVVIPKFVCWAEGPLGAMAPTVLRALTAADAISQAELLLRRRDYWKLARVEPYDPTGTHQLMKFSIEPWGSGAAAEF